MTRLLLILALTLGLLGSSNSAELNGFVAQSYFSSSKPLPYHTTELGVGVHQNITNNVDIYASGYVSENSKYLSSAFIELIYPIANIAEITVDIGRVRNCYCLYNYTRLHPGTRDQIVLPQSIYWTGLDDFANYTDGVAVKTKVYGIISLAGSFGTFDLHNTRLAEHYLMLPHVSSGRYNVSKYGFSVDNKIFTVGGQRIHWKPESSIFGKYDVFVDSEYIRYNTEGYSIALELIQMHTSVSDSIGVLPARGYSILLTKSFDGASVFINRSYINYNAPMLEYIYPGKNIGVDNSIGIRYSINKNFMLKTEYHIIKGNSFNSPGTTANRDSYLASQIVYMF